MKRKTDAILNDVNLISVNNKIIAVRVLENAVQDELVTESNHALPGQAITGQKRPQLTVSVFAKIKELYDMQSRMAVIDQINTWAAKGGMLKLSYKPGKQLPVKLVKPASAGDIRQYNNEIELLFASNGFAYWQDVSPAAYALSEGAGSVAVPGNAPTTVDATVICRSSITTLTLALADSEIVLNGIGASSGDVISITHDAYGRMSIKNGGESLYPYLSEASDDCLIVPHGVQSYAVASSGTVEVLLYIKGRWL